MRGIAALSVLVVILAAVAATSLPVSAHGNHLSANPQLSADGTVLIETAFVSLDGWLVLHDADGSEIGDPIGHGPLDVGGGLKTDVPVSIDAAAWENTTGSRVVYAALHRRDGDGEFEPERDGILRTFGEPAAIRFTVERSDAPAYVLAERYLAQDTGTNAVTLRKVALPEDGHVVLRKMDGEPGAVVGHRGLPAGSHENVTVRIDESFYPAEGGTLSLAAVAYRDDGDRTLSDGDEPITAGDERVLTTFHVRADTSTGLAADDGSLVNTPSTAEGGSLVNTPRKTTRPGDGGTVGGTNDGTTIATGTATATPHTTTGEGSPGFGVGVVLVALGLVALLGRKRR